MRRLTFPRILIVFYGVAVAAALLIYFLTGRNLPIRETILILTFLFTTLRERFSSGNGGALAPLVTGGVLFLACQGCIGMIL